MEARLERLDGIQGPIDGSMPTRTANATLIHGKSTVVTREDLIALPPVQGTDTFKPVPHIELIRGIEHSLQDAGIGITAEKFCVNRKGAAMFGVMDLGKIAGALVTPDFSAAMGIRAANDKTMSIQLGVGSRVFICDNLAFGADMIALKRKHTSGLDLMQALKDAVGRFIEKFWTMSAQFEALKNQAISRTDAKVKIYDVFAKGLVAPMYFPAVNAAYFNELEGDTEIAGEATLVPFDAEYKDTVWALHNAFTWALKPAPMPVQQNATMALAREFALN